MIVDELIQQLLVLIYVYPTIETCNQTMSGEVQGGKGGRSDKT